LVWAIGPWASPVIAFALIGLDLSLRDWLHDQHGFVASLGMVGAAGALAFVANPAAGKVAMASCAAFVAAGLADAVAYQVLRRRVPLVRMNGSNLAGALVDSIIFPTVAFGGLMPGIVALQFVAKVIGGAMWAWLLTRRGGAA
jgi:uncharacterized PurR-regulated membrane protein YhhQ (DUF165 family)